MKFITLRVVEQFPSSFLYQKAKLSSRLNEVYRPEVTIYICFNNIKR